jgi:hypothetical protein
LVKGRQVFSAIFTQNGVQKEFVEEFSLIPGDKIDLHRAYWILRPGSGPKSSASSPTINVPEGAAPAQPPTATISLALA